MRLPILGLVLSLAGANGVVAQTSAVGHELTQLSKDKWQWMADKDVGKLEPLFHDRSKFVHMGGTWGKAEELDIIKSGRIWYKQTDVHAAVSEVFENTAIVWSRITLHAMLGSNEVVTEFTVTEVFQRQGTAWKILDLTFSSVRDNHRIRE
ncbi:MAG: nuclear transport factor 2 family protein [Gemmatimonadota bacterium]|nr:nuclear transport factor 2 family protein [Gemmatimonadota bacterium]